MYICITKAPEQVDKVCNYIMNNFQFNENGVCINPNTYVILERPNWATNYITIQTYQIGDNWFSRRSIIFNRFGHGGFDSPPFDNEKDSYNYQKKEVLKYLDQNIRTDNEKSIISGIHSYFNHFPDQIQLSLF